MADQAASQEISGQQDELVRTPRWTKGMVQRMADFPTLADGLDYAATGVTGFNFYAPRGALEHVLPHSELRKRARQTGRRLLNAGVRRGSRVAIVAETGPEFIITFFACQYAGILPCPLPYAMNIGGRDAYVARIEGMLNAGVVSAVVTPASLQDSIAEAANRAGADIILSYDELAEFDDNGELRPFQGDDMAYIQYSSGSTSAPKGVLISQKAIMTNSRRILVDGMKASPIDRGFSWLPLYHDMGLVGFCLSPLLGQGTTDFLATPAFARRPLLWIKLLSENRSTVCYAPSFGYDLVVKRIKDAAADYDLSNLRIAGIGGDMVRPEVLSSFAEKMAPSGFTEKMFMPSYGMAEFTLAVSFPKVDESPLEDVVDRIAMKDRGVAEPASPELIANHPENVRTLVACGSVIKNHEMKICDKDGKQLGAREIGRVLVKGASVMSGYYQNLIATKEVIDQDGFLDTGDLGYLLGSQVVLTGRAKELILHNGRNIWPQDLEWAAEQLDDLRSGDVAAFGVEDENGVEQVTVLAQCRYREADKREELAKAVGKVVYRSAGVECVVVLVPPRALPFTSSGKLSRAGAKVKFLSGEIEELTND